MMDSSVVFADSLVLPRSLSLVGNGALIAENIPLWYYEDTDGDLQADQRILVDSTYGGDAIVEHSPNGLLRGLDGWFYNAKSTYRYKKINGQWVKEETAFRGQWGLSMDNIGRLYYNYNWSQLHADLVPPNYLNRNPNHTPTSGIDHGLTTDREIFPVRQNLAANRGGIPGTLDDLGRLKEFTSACSPFVYRGDLFSQDFKENVFVCEPTGNLIKRNIVISSGYQIAAKNAYDGFEFIASEDERFRPVALSTGPDGALYIADMYRGIIQHGLYMTEYLRDITLERKLDQHIHYGRIWKVVPESFSSQYQEKLSDKSNEELVGYIHSENGWYRDRAQWLIADRNAKEVIPLIEDIIEDTTTSYTARIHSLWILHHLGYNQSDIYFKVLGDPSDKVRALAIRLIEWEARKNPDLERKLGQWMLSNWKNQSSMVALQIALSVGSLNDEMIQTLVPLMIKDYYHLPLMRDALMSSILDFEPNVLNHLWDQPDWQEKDPNKAIMLEILSASIMKSMDSIEIKSLLSKLNVAPAYFDWKEESLLNGMSYSISESKTQVTEIPRIVSDSAFYDKELIQSIRKLSHALSWPGKPERIVEKSEKGELAIDPEVYLSGRQQYINICAGCHGNDGKGMERFAPPLRNSEWVLGSEKRLTLILTHGMQGPVTVAGKEYDIPVIMPEMPSFSNLDGEKMASIMTYIRNEWGHKASPVDPGSVGKYRIRNQGKIEPWTQEELLNIEDGAKPY